MSFFYPNKDKFTDGNISYNYPLTSIYKRDVEEKKTYSETMKKPNSYVDIEGDLIDIKDDYYMMDFKGRENQFQDVKIGSNTYFTKKIYVYGALHNNINGVSNDDITGEIVIEHTDLSPEKKRIFTCFLLKNRKDYVENTVDKLINLLKNKDNNKDDTIDVSLELNKDIPEQKQVIRYENASIDAKKHIYIFLEPILVNRESSEFLEKLTYKTNLFSTEAPMDKLYLKGNFSAKSKTSEKESFSGMNVIEGMDSYYFDCNPAGESEETTPSYVVPVNSKYSESKAKTDSLQVFVHLLVFAIISIVIFFTVPPVYKTLVVDSFIKITPNDRINVYQKVYGFDLIMIILMVFIVFLFMIGSGLNLPLFFFAGVTLLLMSMMTTGVIMFAKGSDAFWKVNDNLKIDRPTTKDYENIGIGELAVIPKMIIEMWSNNSYNHASLALFIMLNIIAIAIYIPISIQKGIKDDRIALIAITSFLLTLPFYFVGIIFETATTTGTPE